MVYNTQHMERGEGGWIKAKKRDSPGFRPPEVSISAYQVELSESAVHAAGHQRQVNLVIYTSKKLLLVHTDTSVYPIMLADVKCNTYTVLA